MFDLSKLFNSAPTTSGVPALYSFNTPMSLFIKNDITNAYKKILIDVIGKCSGLSSKHEHIWWDSYVQSQSGSGLITLLAEAMFNKSELFIVYTADVLRVAKAEEQKLIRDDYKKLGESKHGVYISFQNYDRTDMLRIYSVLEYCLLHSLHKQLNLAKAIQIKVKGIRANVSLGDSAVAIEQAKAIADALSRGEEVIIDKEDEITTPSVDTSPTEKGMDFLLSKRAEILGMPASYVSGEQTPGIGSTGEADMRAVEKGLKQYFYSIIRPAIKDLLNITLEFRSDDFRYISTSLEVLKSFEVTSSELLSTETKRAIIARSFGLDLKEETKRIEKELKEEEEREKSRPVLEEEVDEDEE